MGYLIGVDIGTTGTKTILLDPTVGIVAQATSESPIFSPSPTSAEADASAWMKNVHDGIRKVISDAAVNPSNILAIATTGMVPAVVCLDKHGSPLRRPILQNDARAYREIQDIAEKLDSDEMLHATGSVLTQQSVAPTLKWLQTNEPEIWSSTHTIVGSYDYALMALGAVPHVERNWALESGLFDVDGRPFENAYLAADIDRELLPNVAPSGTNVGTVSGVVAEKLGLNPDTALIVGGADHVLSAYAAGIDHTGDWLLKLGGAGDILAAAAEPVTDPRFYLDAHPRDGVWLPNGCMATSGSLLRWYQTLIGGAPLTDLDEEAQSSNPASVLCLPYFLGEKTPLNDPSLRGAFVGLNLSHTRGDLYRSVLEAIAFGFRHNSEALKSAGIVLNRALVTNGGSKSTLWKQILSDVLGTELFAVKNHPGAALGAAILAGVGMGILTHADASHFCEVDAQPYSPDLDKTRRYDEAYKLWRNAATQLEPVSHAMAAADSNA